MKFSMFIFFMFFAFSVSASILECETVILPEHTKGPQFYLADEKIYTIEEETQEVIYFDETHYCGKINKMPRSKLLHKFEDISAQSNYTFEISGISSIKRENYSTDITVSATSVVYGKKNGTSDFGVFSCGLDQIEIRLILKKCIIK